MPQGHNHHIYEVASFVLLHMSGMDMGNLAPVHSCQSVIMQLRMRVVSLYGHVASHIALGCSVQDLLMPRMILMVQALKERLVERANIIQARHDSETAALVKRQVQHHFTQ